MQLNPDLDLNLERVIRAPRATIWKAWTTPALLEQWWIPAPMQARVEQLEVRPGGAFVTSMSEDGQTFTPHVDGMFIVVEPEQRLVFTNAIDSSWHPAAPHPVAMTAEIQLHEHAEGTDYRVVVRHADPAGRQQHADMGFFEGWGMVTAALAALAEAEARAASGDGDGESDA